MMNKQTGGPAFPEIGNVAYNSDWESEPGMTLRDFFAAKAMQGLISHHDTWGLPESGIALKAYEMADLMLSARE